MVIPFVKNIDIGFGESHIGWSFKFLLYYYLGTASNYPAKQAQECKYNRIDIL
jgi:hypothetical protein